jgi:hypothetical protein
MPTKLHPLALKQGLDLVTPPMLVEAGAMIDCLNYEMTDVAGYRRIDGYEKYDGYPNGGIYNYYRVIINAITPSDQSLLGAGGVISRTGLSGTVDIGVIVGGSWASTDTGPYYYDIVPRTSTDAFITDEDYMELEGGGFLTLESEAGILKLIADDYLLGNDFTVTPSGGGSIAVNVPSVPQSGREIFSDPTEFLDQLHTYGSVLRQLVGSAPAPVAATYWFEDRLLAAVNGLHVTLSITGGSTPPAVGTIMRWSGNYYRVPIVDKTASGANDIYDVYLLPTTLGTGTVPNDDNLVEVDSAATVGTTWITGVTTTANPTTVDSKYAFLGYFKNPLTDNSRGFQYMTPSYSFAYDAGSHAPAGSSMPLITMDQAASPADKYWVVGADGAVFTVRLNSLTLETGTFAGSNATGRINVSYLAQIAGTRSYLKDNDVIHNVYPTTGTSNIATVNGATLGTRLAGTGLLKTNNTKYQWGTFNFYGQSSTLAAYGVTGATRAFWATKNYYGTIRTQTDSNKDQPKYVAFHGNRLALGFKTGSVIFSAVGVPYDIEGFDGAIEIATGDDITGLLELPGDTLAVFGRRTIRKITGSNSSDMSLGTISGNSGCFDYTACLVGANAVYTNASGVTTLDQTSAYGDFVGRRISDKISNWLRPKLTKTGTNIEDGGVVMAYVCRSKNQYRLFLQTGEMITFTINPEGATCTFQNYGLSGELRVPFTLSSEVGSDQEEHIHVVWDNSLLSRDVFELESGWGFNGKEFSHYFDISPIFDTQSVQNYTVSRVRMYGTSYGTASLVLKTAAVEDGFGMDYQDQAQDISMPRNPELLYIRAKPVTGIVDTASWGLGIKLRIQGSLAEGSAATEPPHNCQVLIIHEEDPGVEDN